MNTQFEKSFQEVFCQRANKGEKQMHHELKTDPVPFQDSANGGKSVEIRLNDRGFKVGDTLTLRETRFTAEQMRTVAHPLEYTGNSRDYAILHVQTGYGLSEGYCALSIIPVVLAAAGEQYHWPKDKAGSAR